MGTFNQNTITGVRFSSGNNIEKSFFSEKIFVRELDYYFTNSISRSSKTMSECRQIRQKIKKDGTNN